MVACYKFILSSVAGVSALAAASAADAAEATCNIVSNAATQAVVTALTAPQTTPTYNSLIVKLKTERSIKAVGLALGFDLENASRTGGGEYVVPVPPGGAALLETLKGRDDVEYAEPNYLLQPQITPNDPCYATQWHYFQRGLGAGQSRGGVSLPGVWDSNTGAPTIVAAVIDTGQLYKQQPDVNPAAFVPGWDMITRKDIARDGDGRDKDPTDPGDNIPSWHGTHVSGTVGALLANNKTGAVSIGWKVKIQPVRVLGFGGGELADIEDGIRWAAGLPVPRTDTNKTPARVLNLSLGGRFPCPASMQAAIDEAIGRGALIVVAAGNSGADAADFSPASCKGVLTVAATDALGEQAFYSNYGPRIDLAAPGGDTRVDRNGDGAPDGVLSTIKGGYAYYMGTSMAAPHVAGVAALLLSKTPTLTAPQVVDALRRTAGPAVCPKGCGAGLLDAQVAK
jgi:serine protease